MRLGALKGLGLQSFEFVVTLVVKLLDRAQHLWLELRLCFLASSSSRDNCLESDSFSRALEVILNVMLCVF